ncbi:MAG: hypothetical protein NTZ21_15230 [Actinobacteria bacterium]|nr:hypothetical protein [Actinomycetota bacterium]
MHDLEDRLRTLDLTPPPLAPRAIAARVERRRRHRRMVTAGAAAVLVLATVGSLAVMATGNDDATIAPATAPSDPPPVSTPAPIAPDSTEPPTPDTNPGSTSVDLSGVDGGLYLDPALLPSDLFLIGATSYEGPFGTGSSEFGVFTTTLVQYTADRTRIDASMTVETLLAPDRIPVSFIGEAESEPIEIRGIEMWTNGRSLAWNEGPWTIIVNGLPSDDLSMEELDALLRDVAEHVVVDADGRTSVTPPPPGWEALGTLPDRIVDDGTLWTTNYVTPEATTGDEPVLQLTVTTRPGRPAEYLLSDAIRTEAFATDVLGRRAIVTGGRGFRIHVEVTWNEADGSQIQLAYSPLRADLDVDDVRDEAIRLAHGVRRAGTAQWSAMVTEARVTGVDFLGQAWIDPLVAAEGHQVVSVGQLDFAQPAVVLVAVATPDGTPDGTCEISLRVVVACTALDDPLVGSSGEARTGTLDGGRLRLIASPDVQYVTVRTGQGGQQRATEPLSNDAPAFEAATSPRIAYLSVPIVDGRVCVDLGGANDPSDVIATFELVDGELVASESCEVERAA